MMSPTPKLDNIWSELVEMGLFTEDELNLVTSLLGYTEDTLNKAIYVRTGCNSLESYKAENFIS